MFVSSCMQTRDEPIATGIGPVSVLISVVSKGISVSKN